MQQGRKGDKKTRKKKSGLVVLITSSGTADTSRKVVWRRPTVVIVRPGVAAPPLQQAGHQHPQQARRSLLPSKTIYSLVIVIPVIVQLLSAVAGSRFVNFHETFG